MPIEDFIRIRGDKADTAPFQGIGGGGVSGDDTSFTVTVSAEGGGLAIAAGDISDALWNAQNAIISGETDYLTQLNTQWKHTQGNLEGGTWDSIWTAVSETFEEIISVGVFAVLAKAGVVLTGGASVVVGVLVSLAAGFGLNMLKEAFIEWLREGNKLLEAMKSENTALLAVEQSRINYEHRNQVILRHERMISRLLTELESLRKGAEQVVSTGGGTTTTPDEEEDGWDTVMTSLGSSIDNLDEWVSNVETADTADTPVPSAPSLPAIPEDGKKAVSRKIAFLLARYGFKLATELLRKNRETDTHITDLVEQIKNLNISLQNGLGDLKYNDEIVDFGSVRIHHKAKIIETS